MWKRFSLRSRLILILLTVSLLAAGIVIVLGAMVGNESITREVNERLVSVRNAKAFEVEQYFTSLSNVVEVLADNDLSGRAVIEFSQSFNAINEVDTIDCSAELNDFYVDFIDRLSERLEVRRSVSAFYPQSPAACYLQYSTTTWCVTTIR